MKITSYCCCVVVNLTFMIPFSQLRTQNEIMVMELCSGGSLFTMLENPSNAYGFQEDEFKQVVKDVGKTLH